MRAVLRVAFLALTALPVGLNAQQIDVTADGAVSDAFSMADGVISLGAPTTLKSASGRFSARDVGEICSVQGAGATSSLQLIASIKTYISPTQVVLSAPAGMAVRAAGIICGTDNYKAFNSAFAAAAGGHLTIPSGNYLINTQGGARILAPRSNTVIAMDRSGTLFFVGALSGTHTGSAMISIPDGETNIRFDGVHCVGELLGSGPSWGSWNWSACITFVGSTTTNVQITNGIFENQIGSGINGKSINVDISHNVFQNDGGTGINVNGDYADVSDNYSFRDGGFEMAGAESNYSRNRIRSSTGQYALAVGGNTAGSPYHGTTVTDNIIVNPAQSCISIGDGFSSGVIADNNCSGVSGTFGGIYNVYHGRVHTDNNLFVNNVVTGNYSGPCFLFANVTGVILRGNYGAGSSKNCLQIYGGSIDSVGNTWVSTGSFNDISNAGGVLRTQDYLAGTGRHEMYGTGAAITADSSFSIAHGTAKQ